MKPSVLLGAAATIVTLATVGLLAIRFEPTEAVQVGTRLVGSVLVLVLVAAALRIAATRRNRLALVFYALAAFAALATYYNFGAFHRNGLVHEHELFHYYLGAKYFPELGYDGLYLASLAVDAQERPGTRVQPFVRNLRTNELEPTQGIGPRVLGVRARFSEARWEAFVEDHQAFRNRSNDAVIRAMRRDHGYNPTPAWTFVAQRFTSVLPTAPWSLSLIASLDFLLLGLAFVALGRTFGLPILCLSIAVLGLGYGWRFHYIGGAFLRLDWLAAVVGAVCLLERRRFAWAGVLFGYAAAVRGFPALLMLGPGVLALRALVRGQDVRWAFAMAGGFVVIVGLAVAAGTTTGRGPGAWREFAENIAGHRQLTPPNRVGFDNVLLNTPELVAAVATTGSPVLPPWKKVDVERIREERLPVAVGAKLALLALLAVALWRARSHAEAAVLSLTALFAAVPLGSYYWAVLLLVPIRGGPAAVLALLTLSTAMKGAQLAFDSETTRYALKSLGLAAFFTLWTAAATTGRPAAWPTSPPKSPPSP